MDRKQFLIGSGAVILTGAGQGVETSADHKQKFQQEWLRSLLENLDVQLDEKTRTALMESCGRACARRGSLAGLAKACQGDVNKFVAGLAQHVGRENARRDGDTIQLVYPRCYCPLVAEGPAKLSNTFCNCSRGYVLEIFETVVGRAVSVKLTHAIKRGDPFCKFIVRL